MRLLIDAQLPPALARWFAGRGLEAEHVACLGLLDAADATIAEFVEREDMIRVSKDEDFVLLRLPDRFVLLWLRIGNATNHALLAWIEPRWPMMELLLGAGERLVEVR